MASASLPAHRLLLLLTSLVTSAPKAHGEDLQLSFSSAIGIPFASQTLGHPPVTLDERVWAMQFTPDGKELLTVTDKIDQISWPSKERRILWQQSDEQTMDRAIYSPDGTRFARSNNGNKVSIHETATGNLLHTFQGRNPRFTATAFSPDGKRLAIGVNHEVVIYDVASGEPGQRLPFGTSDITSLAWSPNDQWIAAVTEKPDKEGNSIFVRALRGETAPVNLPGRREARFSFTPDSSILAVASEIAVGESSWREVLYFQDTATGKEIFRREGHGYNQIVHSPDGKWLAACGLNEVLILDSKTGREVTRQYGDSINSHIWSVAFSPDGKVIAIGVEDRIRFRDTTTWAEIDADDSVRAPMSAMAFSADGRHLVTGAWNGDLVLWDWEKKKPAWKKLAPPEVWEIKALSIDPAARWIGVVQCPRQANQGTLRLVDFASGETVRDCEVENVTFSPPLFHPLRHTAYLATRDHEIVEWDCESGEILRRVPVPFLRTIDSGRYGTIDSLSFDPADPNVLCWNAETQASGRIHLGSGVESHTLEARIGRPDSDPIPPRTHEFAAIGSSVWNFPSLHEATSGSESTSSGPSIRHPSDLLQFSAWDKSVRIFDILSQSFIHSVYLGPGQVKALALSPDGRTLVAASTSGTRHFTLEGLPVPVGTPTNVLWQLMGGENHWQAYQAAWALARQPDFIPFLESHLPPAAEPTSDEISRFKELLVDGDYKVRQVAARQWLDLGLELDRATYETLREGKLPETWPGGLGPEVFESFVGYDPTQPIPLLTPLSSHRRAMRAVMLLKDDRSDAGLHHLERLAGAYAGAPLTKAAVKALAARNREAH